MRFCVDGYKLSHSNRKFLSQVNIHCAMETLSKTVQLHTLPWIYIWVQGHFPNFKKLSLNFKVALYGHKHGTYQHTVAKLSSSLHIKHCQQMRYWLQWNKMDFTHYVASWRFWYTYNVVTVIRGIHKSHLLHNRMIILQDSSLAFMFS